MKPMFNEIPLCLNSLRSNIFAISFALNLNYFVTEEISINWVFKTNNQKADNVPVTQQVV